MTERWYVLQGINDSEPAFFAGGRYTIPSLKEAKKYRTRADAESVSIWVTKNWFPVKVVPIEIRVVSEE